jgi:hypothetical protein
VLFVFKCAVDYIGFFWIVYFYSLIRNWTLLKCIEDYLNEIPERCNFSVQYQIPPVDSDRVSNTQFSRSHRTWQYSLTAPPLQHFRI